MADANTSLGPVVSPLLFALGLCTLVLAVLTGLSIDLANGPVPTAEALTTYSMGLRFHLYLGFCALVSPWPMLLRQSASAPVAPRPAGRRLAWLGVVCWLLSSALLVAGLGEPRGVQASDVLAGAYTVTILKQALMVTVVAGSLLALAGSWAVRRPGSGRLAALLQSGLLLATLGITLSAWLVPVDGVAELIGISDAHPLFGDWIGLWTFPIGVAGMTLALRWSGPAMVSATFATGLCVAGLTVSLWARGQSDIVLFDTSAMAIAEHHAVYGWPLMLLAAGASVASVGGSRISAYVAIACLLIGALACSIAAAQLAELGMPRRMPTHWPEFETMHNLLSAGRWMAAVGFGAAVIIGFARRESGRAESSGQSLCG